MSDIRNIARIDTGRTHGWQVRVTRQGIRQTKFFADRQHGSLSNALHAAQQYRDALVAQLPAPDDGLAKARLKRSRSGVPGLRFVMAWDGNRSKEYKPYILIEWVERDGKRRKRAWSVHKWGLRKATWSACRALHRVTIEAGRVPGAPVPTWYATAYPRLKRQYLRALPEGAVLRGL